MRLPTFCIGYHVIAIIQFIQLCQAQTCSKPTVKINDVGDLEGLSMDTYKPKPLADGQTMYDFMLYYLPSIIGDFADPVGSAREITNPNFELDIPSGTVDTKRTVFGVEIDATDFTMRFYNNFVSKTTGYHTFSISADDGAMISIMHDFTYFCCKNITTMPGGKLHQFWMDTYETYSTIIEDTGSSSDTKEVSIYLEADTLVLLEMVVINKEGSANFDFSIVDPNGNSIIGLPGYLYEVEDVDVYCNRITEVTETADVLATTTYSSTTVTSIANIFGIPEYNTIYYVQVPSEVPITSSSVPEPSSSTIESSSEATSDASSSAISSSTESSVISSSTIETSSEVTSEITLSVVSSSTESLVISSSTIETSSEFSSEIPTSAESSSTGGSIEQSSTAVSSSTETLDSSTYTESSTKSLNSYSSSVVSSLVSSQLTSSALSSDFVSSQTTSSDIMSTETTSSDIYSSVQYTSSNVESEYTNPPSIEPSDTIQTSVITTAISRTETEDYDSEIKSKTTVTTQCTSDKCNTASLVTSTQHATETIHYTTTVTTVCSETHAGSIEVATSTYTTVIETVITHPVCSGDCSVDSIYVSQTEPLTALVQASSTGYPKVLTSSTTHLVNINENSGIHFSSSVAVLFVSLLSILTTF